MQVSEGIVHWSNFNWQAQKNVFHNYSEDDEFYIYWDIINSDNVKWVFALIAWCLPVKEASEHNKFISDLHSNCLD